MQSKAYPNRVPLPTQLDGVQAWLVPDTGNPYLLVELDKPARTLNSSPWGGGLGYHKYLLNRQVDLTYNCNDPIAEMEAFLQAQLAGAAGDGLPDDGRRLRKRRWRARPTAKRG